MTRSTPGGPPCKALTRRTTPAVRRASRGRSEAEDVAQQHPLAPFAVEDQCADARVVPALPAGQAAAHGLPDLRDVQQPPGRQRLSGVPAPRPVRLAVDLLG